MNDLVAFDYELLSSDQAQRTQDAELKIIGRTQKAIIENGKDLLAVKADIGHGHFTNWLQSIGLNIRTADRWMSVAENFGQIGPGDQFENHALYLLSSSRVPESARQEAKQRAEEGEKITEETAKQIRDAHKAREQAEERLKHLEQETTRALAEQDTLRRAEIDRLTSLMQAQEAEIAKLQEQPEQIVDTPETLARLAELEASQRRLKEERDRKAERVEVLTKEVQKYVAADKEEKHNEQIRNKWRQACDFFHQGINQGAARMVTPLDAQQAFEPDDWARLAEVEATLRQALETLSSLRESVSSQFVESFVQEYSHA